MDPTQREGPKAFEAQRSKGWPWLMSRPLSRLHLKVELTKSDPTHLRDAHSRIALQKRRRAPTSGGK